MRSPAIWVLLGAVVLSLGAMHLYFKRGFALSGVLIALAIIGMVAVRHALRTVVLDGRFDASAMAVHPQWGVFAIFLVCFAAALATVGYMIATYARAARVPDAAKR
jgi:hypothetical protein